MGPQRFKNSDRLHCRQNDPLRAWFHEHHSSHVHRSKSKKRFKQLPHYGVFAKNCTEDVPKHLELAQQTNDSTISWWTCLERNLRFNCWSSFWQHYHAHCWTNKNWHKYASTLVYILIKMLICFYYIICYFYRWKSFGSTGKSRS